MCCVSQFICNFYNVMNACWKKESYFGSHIRYASVLLSFVICFFRPVLVLYLLHNDVWLLSVLYVLDIWYSFGRDDNESLNVSNHLLHLNSNICLDLLGVIVSIILSARLRCFLLACDWCLYVSCCQLGCHVSLFFSISSDWVRLLVFFSWYVP